MPCTWKSRCPHPNISLRPNSSAAPPKSLPRPPRQDRHPLAPDIPLYCTVRITWGQRPKGRDRLLYFSIPRVKPRAWHTALGTTPNVTVSCRFLCLDLNFREGRAVFYSSLCPHCPAQSLRFLHALIHCTRIEPLLPTKLCARSQAKTLSP